MVYLLYPQRFGEDEEIGKSKLGLGVIGVSFLLMSTSPLGFDLFELFPSFVHFLTFGIHLDELLARRVHFPSFDTIFDFLLSLGTHLVEFFFIPRGSLSIFWHHCYREFGP